ncbi:DnaA/Hda family protein [Rhizobium mongolense]|uniref:DnaA ATPase domain-containing protein n=1 Tax=Rhizobium mongolense TaxID=57676 RepID=UPI0034A3C2EA
MTYDQKQLGTALVLYGGGSPTTMTSAARCNGALEARYHWEGQAAQCLQWGSGFPFVNLSSSDWHLASECHRYSLCETSMVNAVSHPHLVPRAKEMICDSFGQQLDRTKTFDTFVIGPENAAVMGQILDPACGSGSFLLLGDKGTGKSHLLSALAQAAIQQGQNVRFLTAEYLFWRFATGRLEADLKRTEPVVDLFLLDNAEYFNSKAINHDLRKAIALLKAQARRMVVASNQLPWTMASLDLTLHALLFQGLVVELKPLGQETLHWINRTQGAASAKNEYADTGWHTSQVSPWDEGWIAFIHQITIDKERGPSPWLKLGRLFDVYLAVDAVGALYDASLAEVLSVHVDAVVPEARSVLLFLLADDLGQDLKDLADCFGETVAAVERMRMSLRYRLDQGGLIFERVSILRKAIDDGLARQRYHLGHGNVVK